MDEQRIRLARRLSQVAGSGAAGFTLVELLVTIAVLGVLSAVVVFAVGGLRIQSQASACSADRSTIDAAMEAHRARFGTYVSERDLVAAGQLRDESTLHDVVLDADGSGYTLTGVGACAETDAAVEAAGADEVAGVVSTTTLAPSTTTVAPTTTSAPPTTTTTKKPVKLKALRLSAVCTNAEHWPAERGWSIKNSNSDSVDFVLDAVNSHASGHEIATSAPSGSSTWFLPAADRGTNTATLTALDKHSTVKNTKSRC